MAKRQREKTVATLMHEEASRKNIPTAEFRSLMERAKRDMRELSLAQEL